ncbi:MAG: molybdenum cofactor guanylyltransferase [Cellvibrionaceae bacterium]|nr:molybdenum cofactor guanylyltransferase [Cellvibrionaceae bacterium]
MPPTHSRHRHSTALPIVILTGGQSRRLRIMHIRRKWQLPFGNTTLLGYIIKRLTQQAGEIIINCAHHIDADLLRLPHRLLPDFNDPSQGPLSGLQCSLHWAYEHNVPWIATAACDTPFLPDNLLSSLYQATQTSVDCTAVIACSQGRKHPLFGLWSTDLLPDLEQFLQQSPVSSMSAWLDHCHTQQVDFPLKHYAKTTVDPFFNINRETHYKTALTIRARMTRNTRQTTA